MPGNIPVTARRQICCSTPCFAGKLNWPTKLGSPIANGRGSAEMLRIDISSQKLETNQLLLTLESQVLFFF